MKKIFLGFGFFVGDVISGLGLGLFSLGYQALGINCKRKYFAEVFSAN